LNLECASRAFKPLQLFAAAAVFGRGADDVKAARRILLVQRVHVRNRLFTGSAPRSPEVDEDDVAGDLLK